MLDDHISYIRETTYPENYITTPTIIPKPDLTAKAQYIIDATGITNRVSQHAINGITKLEERVHAGAGNGGQRKAYKLLNDWVLGGYIFGQMTDEVAAVGEKLTENDRITNMHRNCKIGIPGNLLEVGLATTGVIAAQSQIPFVEHSAEAGALFFYAKNAISFFRNVQRLFVKDGPALPAWGMQTLWLHLPYLTGKASSKVYGSFKDK